MNDNAFSVPAYSSLTDDELRSVAGGTRWRRPGGASGELEMIQLQSLMSQRQLAINRTTSVMTSLDSTTRDILDNIGD